MAASIPPSSSRLGGASSCLTAMRHCVVSCDFLLRAEPSPSSTPHARPEQLGSSWSDQRLRANQPACAGSTLLHATPSLEDVVSLPLVSVADPSELHLESSWLLTAAHRGISYTGERFELAEGGTESHPAMRAGLTKHVRPILAALSGLRRRPSPGYTPAVNLCGILSLPFSGLHGAALLQAAVSASR